MIVYKNEKKHSKTTKIFVFLTDSISEEMWKTISEALLKTPLSDSVAEVLEKKNTEEKHGSIAARALLLDAYRASFGEPCPPLLKTRHGAPYFKNGTRVSFSHTRGGVAVALSPDGRYSLGVDIECGAYNKARAEGVERRFLSALRDGRACTDAELFLACLADPAALAFTYEPLAADEPSDRFLLRFTRAEAVMKCSGRGFGALRSLAPLSQSAELSTVSIRTDGAPLVLSYARRGRGPLSRLFLKLRTSRVR